MQNENDEESKHAAIRKKNLHEKLYLNQVRKSYFEGVRKMRIFTPSQNTGVV
jgi:hypothetical protein